MRLKARPGSTLIPCTFLWLLIAFITGTAFAGSAAINCQATCAA